MPYLSQESHKHIYFALAIGTINILILKELVASHALL